MKAISSPATRQGWGKQQKAEYDAQRYHRPTDEYRADMDFRADARLAQFGFLLGWQALSSAPVTWKPGDEFEAARKKEHRAIGPLEANRAIFALERHSAARPGPRSVRAAAAVGADQRRLTGTASARL